MTEGGAPAERLGWRALPGVARLYVVAVIVTGAAALVARLPVEFPRPYLFGALLAAACLTSAWKVNLPMPLANASTLSVAYAASLVALLLLGTPHAMIVAVTGTWTQCTFRPKQRYPLYRTVFSIAAVAITIAATGAVYMALGGGAPPADFFSWSRPLVAAIATCFVVNTGLVAGAIAVSTRQRITRIWRDDFLWSGASFMVAGTAGAAAAMVIEHGHQWTAVLLAAPVYLTYRTYELVAARLEDQKRHLAEVRRLHLEAVAARASAEQANQLKDQFLAVVSHELRTPLNAILGWADMLRRGSIEGPRRERAARAIYDSGRRQAQLIDELLDVARIMSGKLRLDSEPVDLAAIVRSAVDVVSPSAAEKQIQIDVEADPAVPPVRGDSARLEQIVWNLLSNAVKFTPVEGQVRVRLNRDGGDAALTVTDTGPGISRDFLPLVFEPFRQADGSTTRHHGGLGLGLSIARHLAQAHGGAIGVHSDGEGRGATFTVRLPLLDAERTAQTPGTARAAPGNAPARAPSLRGLRVLVVDDDEESRQVVAAHLEARDARVFSAATAAEALSVLGHTPIDVLLADIAMPGEDGYSLIRRVRAFSPRTASLPAAALTAFARDEDRARALQAGFQRHIAKPIDPDSLVAVVASLADGRRSSLTGVV